LAKTIYPLYRDSINFYGGQFTYMQASGLMLDLRGQEMGVLRKEARKTRGNLRLTYIKALTIPEGAWFVTPSGLRYKSISNVSLSTGQSNVAEDGKFQGNVAVEAEFPGAVYNILAGSAMRTTSVLDGVDSITVPKDWVTTPGRDRELDEDYRQRIKAKWDAQGADNRPGKYEHIALTVDGVDDVKVIRTPRGFGSIDVVIAGYAEISESVKNEVKKKLADSYLLTRDIIVRAAKEEGEVFELSFSSFSRDTTQSKVKNTLRAWLQRRKIGQAVTMKGLYQEALSSLDISKLEYKSPTRDIEVAPDAKVTPQSIIVDKEP